MTTMNAASERSTAATCEGTARLRAFLAVPLPQAVRERVARLKHTLASTGVPVRWARDQGLHVTLKFLGSVTAARLDAVQAAVRPLLAGVEAFSVRVAGLGAFPRPQRPRVVWVGIDAPPLTELAALVDRGTSSLGFTPESRPFRSHVTLGRIKDSRACAPLAAALEEHRQDVFGTFEVRQVTAFRSDLQRGGSVYTELWEIPLIGTKRTDRDE